MSDQISIDVTALRLSLTKDFKQLHPVSEERCIYRVPKRLRVLNEKAYTPQCVSIGPYHHGKDELKAMEEYKTLYLKHFLRHSTVSLDEFISCVRDNEKELRKCYQERINLESERFVRLVLVDSVFVIMVLLKNWSKDFCVRDELLFYKPWMITDIRTDLLLLENQVPFFILEKLLILSNLEVGSFPMVQMSSNFINSLLTDAVNPLDMSMFSECKHLVDFLRIGQQPLELNKHKALDVMNIPSAVELDRAGVQFKRGLSQRLMDINFSFRDGIMEIPLLRITDDTEILFRNLQAFEQSNRSSDESYFNNYITMMSSLVKNGNDVDILMKNGIIESWLRSNEQVVHLLHNLCKQNAHSPDFFYFTDVVNDLNKFCIKRRNRWRASLIQNYLYNPWVIISIGAATCVILLTIIQTICSILQV